MSVIGSNILAGAAGQGGGYTIERSLRFRSSASAYLSRTPASAGNRKTWTWSGWVKRGALGGSQFLFDEYSAANDNSVFSIYFDSNNALVLSGWTSTWRITTQVFRDPSAWYHIVIALDTTQATAGNRVKLYVNGVEVTSFSTSTNPSQNADLGINQAAVHTIGKYANGSLYYLDGYLTEVNFIDGQALDPTYFGDYNTDTGVWQPKKYAGTYGTNGFYLNFSDNTTTTTLGYDGSGNGNNWTANNISLTSGATYDSMTDVPTPYADGGNYCTLNPLNRSTGTAAANLYDGNLRVSPSGGINATPGAYALTASTFQVSSGKWYFESIVVNPVGGYGANAGWTNSVSFNFNQASIYTANITQVSASMGNTSLRMIAYDADTGKVWIGTNGTWDSGDPSTGTGGSSLTAPAMPFVQAFQANASNQCDVAVNFGQRPFAYTPPSGFKSLNTFNLPDSDIVDGSQYFDVVTRSGTGSAVSVSSLLFQPNAILTKLRNTAYNWYWADSVRGVSKTLSTDTTGAEQTPSPALFTSFNSDGYTLGTNTGSNGSTYTYVDYVWKESATAGFDIVTYTGNGVANRVVNHSLGVTPAMILVKARNSSTYAWNSWHHSLSAGFYIQLNTTSAQDNSVSIFPSGGVTSTGWNTGGDAIYNNGNGVTYVAYLFAEVPGFSKFGKYTGNGSSDGPFLHFGFRARWIMYKRTDSNGQWNIIDTARNPYNQLDTLLRANLSNADEINSVYAQDITANGWKIRSTNVDVNTNGATYIYMAFAEVPMKYSLGR